jgi:hypothetical protein
MAIVIASLFHLSIDHIERDQGQCDPSHVQRPDNAALDCSKLIEQLNIHIEHTNFTTTIQRCLQAFV